MEQLSIRKIYVDSRFLTNGTTSSFEYELPEIVNLPMHSAAYITEFCCVNGWDTINDSNNQLYVVERNSSGVTRARVETLNSGSYDSESLRLEVESKLNGPSKHVAGVYTVTQVTSAGANQSSGASYRYYAVTLSGGGSFLCQMTSFCATVTAWVPYGSPHGMARCTRRRILRVQMNSSPSYIKGSKRHISQSSWI